MTFTLINQPHLEAFLNENALNFSLLNDGKIILLTYEDESDLFNIGLMFGKFVEERRLGLARTRSLNIGKLRFNQENFDLGFITREEYLKNSEI